MITDSFSNRGGRQGDDLERTVNDLCTKLHDDLISECEIDQLNDLLLTYPEARQHYLRCVLLHRMLFDSIGKQGRVEAEALAAHVDSGEVGSAIEFPNLSPLPTTSTNADNASSIVSFGWIPQAIIGLLIVAFVSAVSLWVFNQKDEVTKSNSNNDPPKVELAIEGHNALAADVSYVSSKIRWRRPNDAPSSGSSVMSGQHLNIEHGAVELTYLSGTKLLLMGPVSFVVENEGGRLLSGGVVASVPEAGYGFSIQTPNGKVVDLGTEFGLAVDDFGVSEVSVFEGKVEAFPITEQSDGQ